MRSFYVGLLVSLSLLFAVPGWGQPKPQSPAQKAFAKFLALNGQGQLKSTAAKNLVTGEATQFTAMERLGPTTAPDGFAMIDSRHAVTRVQALEGKVPVADIYFYLTLSGSAWKVSALRSMALTGMIEGAMQELQQKPKLTAGEKEMLANMKLTLALDRDLRLHFQTHRAGFEKLRSLGAKKSAASETLRRQLGLGRVVADSTPNIQFVIGGMVDNTVGYLYSPQNQPPKITAEEYIWVEKIADHWYLFRTT